MPYYHVFVEYTTKKGKRESAFIYNMDEELAKERFADPYMKGEAFMVGGKFVSEVDGIQFFGSEKQWKDLVLPNGKSPDEASHHYVVDCFNKKLVKDVILLTYYFIISPPKQGDLMESASFLGLDTNWSLATCALQLQEVAVTLVAERKNIKLDKANVEKVLNKKIESLSFNDQYEAFSRQVKTSFNIEMPILTIHLRKMRTKVLHEGYNPKPEETDSIVTFTIGLLKKLKDIS